jgi:ectoine hydroxylase-related dioxygenase (phytanoyl-CoA dioxygenase family)
MTDAATIAAPTTSLSDTQRYAADFMRDGYCVIPNVINRETCVQLRAEIDRIFTAVPATDPEQGYGEGLRVKLFQYSQLIREHIDYSPVIDVVEQILTANCHLISNNIVRNDKSWAISNWHVDEDVLFPLPDGVELDPRVVPLCYILNSQWYLTDVGADDGPTQVVPCSQRAGKHPPKGVEAPEFKEHAPVSIIASAGDVCLQNSQVWHRGAPVKSNNTRYLLQFSYGRRCIAQRFHPFINYRMPEEVFAGASPRRKRLLGFHPRGPWG